jgi:hypothetical protein
VRRLPGWEEPRRAGDSRETVSLAQTITVVGRLAGTLEDVAGTEASLGGEDLAEISTTDCI